MNEVTLTQEEVKRVMASLLEARRYISELVEEKGRLNLQNGEIAEIIKRNRSWLISMAGLDAGVTDYSLRHDLLRLLELADAIKPKDVIDNGPSGITDTISFSAKPKDDTCSTCKKVFAGTFAELKDAWCEKCATYVCKLCWAAHNMNWCRVEKRNCEHCGQKPGWPHSPGCKNEPQSAKFR